MGNNLDNIRSFLDRNISPGYQIIYMQGDASLRSYCRIKDNNNSYILMDSSLDPSSMQDFLKIGGVLKDFYSVPKVIAVDHNKHLSLLEDLGDNSYTRLLNSAQVSEEHLYKHAVELLVDLHQLDVDYKSHNFDFYSNDLLLKEVLLLIDWYYPLVRGKDIHAELRREFIDLWVKIFSQIHFQNNCLVLRDYHADNLMWLHGRNGIKQVGLLDFQDAVIGSYAYDLVSLLEDARRDVDTSVVNNMLGLYIRSQGIDSERFIKDYYILGAQRNSKILGIFARKLVRDRDARYLSFLPRVFAYLSNDLEHASLKSMKEWFMKSELLDEKYLTNILGEV